MFSKNLPLPLTASQYYPINQVKQLLIISQESTMIMMTMFCKAYFLRCKNVEVESQVGGCFTK